MKAWPHHALLLVLLLPAIAGGAAQADALKLLISVEQQTITAPYPARLTLHLHNSGQETLWLHRRVRSEASEGSTLDVHLEPASSLGAADLAAAAQGTPLESAGLPRPKLVKLAPGEDYTERTPVRLVPATPGTKGESDPIWGRYRLSVTYRARYSNADILRRILGIAPWQGEVTSNTIEIELRPPTSEGSVSGRVISSEGRPLGFVLVSLSDSEERLANQMLTDSEGRFSFTHLPIGVWWVTARRPDFTEDSAVFRHVSLTAAEPAGAIELALLPREIYEPQYLLHKPVLLSVTDNAGHPLDKVSLEVIWSSGTVLENVKGQVPDDGIVALELIPGRNFITLKRRGCVKQEYRVDVAAGDAIDGFKLVFECAKK